MPDNDIKGAIALVKRGSCQFDIKAKVAAEHGAIAVLVYDSSGQDPFEPSTTTAPIPLAAISYVAGQQLAQQSGVHVNFNLQLSPTKISTGGQVSPFSSVGPTYENGLKPDLAAIGGFVFSTLPLYRGGYGTLSGTSMASPYVAGVCALFMEAHRSQRDSLYILERFQNYASLVRTGQGVYENTIKQGAGLIQGKRKEKNSSRLDLYNFRYVIDFYLSLRCYYGSSTHLACQTLFQRYRKPCSTVIDNYQLCRPSNQLYAQELAWYRRRAV